ncbi:MAG TPA: class I SAM-dependent methyltransferase [Acidimicrobiales bacterium]|nr:class I SAM-dependent methyltransferase [Acidimicrobiales bacterium]
MNSEHPDTMTEGAMWNRRYAEHPWPTEPDAGLVERVGPLAPGRALDLGCGTGRNSVWLARHGWRVTGVDASSVGLAIALQSARDAGVELDVVEADLLQYRPAPEGFDLVVVANIHLAPEPRAAFYARASAAVAPGGHLFVTGHHLDSLGRTGPPDPQRLFTLEMVADFAPGLVVDSLTREQRWTEASPDPLTDVVLWAHRALLVTGSHS